MQYKNFKGLELSALGLGCMRLPLVDPETKVIDKEHVERMVEYAMKNGINYYDTAWGYHDGNSETVMGEVLSKYPRESYYLATKFPGYDLKNFQNAKEIFEKQLEKLQTPYFDFYLLHNINELDADLYLDDSLGLMDYLMEQKAQGKIKHLGFSCHGQLDTMEKALQHFGDKIEFVQIQLNWLDWKLQNAKAKVEMLKKYGKQIWVMEPVRGGRLATLEDKYLSQLKEVRPEEVAPAWALRFVNDLDGVTMVLSGMSNMDQLQANIDTFSSEKPLSEKEVGLLMDIADEMLKTKTLPCTACRYCTTYCPQGIDIPKVISAYNDYMYNNGGLSIDRVIKTMPEGKQPKDCLGCGACAQVCPQNIKIPEMMAEFAKTIEEYDKAKAAKK